jgi:hypothetical protein
MSDMAKALFGHVGTSTDMRLAAEVRRLRTRVQELEHELALALAAHDTLAASMTVEDDLSTLALEPAEPAYT